MDIGSQRAVQSIVVLPELQDVLKEYTKSVLRDKPTDVLEYSRDWFMSKMQSERMGMHIAACRLGCMRKHEVGGCLPLLNVRFSVCGFLSHPTGQ